MPNGKKIYIYMLVKRSDLHNKKFLRSFVSRHYKMSAKNSYPAIKFDHCCSRQLFELCMNCVYLL